MHSPFWFHCTYGSVYSIWRVSSNVLHGLDGSLSVSFFNLRTSVDERAFQKRRYFKWALFWNPHVIMKMPPGSSVSILCVRIEAITATDILKGKVKRLEGNCFGFGQNWIFHYKSWFCLLVEAINWQILTPGKWVPLKTLLMMLTNSCHKINNAIDGAQIKVSLLLWML